VDQLICEWKKIYIKIFTFRTTKTGVNRNSWLVIAYFRCFEKQNSFFPLIETLKAKRQNTTTVVRTDVRHGVPRVKKETHRSHTLANDNDDRVRLFFFVFALQSACPYLLLTPFSGQGRVLSLIKGGANEGLRI
jgi:hypothetical protein